jgi:hypothetical protein
MLKGATAADLAEQDVAGGRCKAVLVVAQHHEQQVEEGADYQVGAEESPKHPPAQRGVQMIT